MFEYLTPKIELEQNTSTDKINALKKALSKKGLKTEDIEEILSLIK